MTSRSLRAFGLGLVLALGAGCAVPEAPEARGEGTSSVARKAAAAESYERLIAAEKAKEETDERLGRALGRVAPMLTSDQQKGFVRAFQALPDVKGALADYHTSAAALDQELTHLLEAEELLDGGLSAQKVFDAYVHLAASPSPGGALAFAARKLVHDPALSRITASDADVIEKVLIPALPGTFLEQLLLTGSKDEAISAVTTFLAGAGGKCKTVTAWLETYEVLTGLHNADGVLVGGKSVGRALNAIAGLMVIWDLGGELARGDVDAALATFQKGGTTAIGGVADATALLRRFVIGASSKIGPLADGIVRWLPRIGGGLGLVASLFSLADDMTKTGAGAGVRVGADLVAIAGACMALAGVGPALPVALLAVGLHLFADWLDAQQKDEQLRRDVADCLPKSGVSAGILDAMIHAEPSLVKSLSEDIELGPTHIQWLVSVDPHALSSEGHGEWSSFGYAGLDATQIVFSLDANETSSLLRAVAGSGADAGARVEELLLTFAGQGWGAMLSKSEALAWLDRDPEGMYVPDDLIAMHQSVVRAARKYLEKR
ncbi:MAG: hypothetical protein U0270_25645 [Labilithrix sp.]